MKDSNGDWYVAFIRQPQAKKPYIQGQFEGYEVTKWADKDSDEVAPLGTHTAPK